MVTYPGFPAFVSLAKAKKIIRHFNEAGAYNAGSAISADSIGIRGFIFRRLIRKGILVEVTGNRYYLDFEMLKLYRASRAKRISFLVFLLVITGIVVWILSYLK